MEREQAIKLKEENIAAYPFKRGDRIYMQDRDLPGEYIIIKIVDHPVFDIPNQNVIFNYVVEYSTNPKVATGGTPTELNIDMHRVLMGKVIDEETFASSQMVFAMPQGAQFMVFKVCEYLRGKNETNYRDEIKNLIRYLKILKLLPDNLGHLQCKRMLRDIIVAEGQNLLQIKGKYISLRSLHTTPKLDYEAPYGTSQLTKLVDTKMLFDGITKIIESGFFGDVKLK